MDLRNTQLIESTLTGSEQPTMVLLVDDQMMVAEAVRRLLDGLPDIDLHYCSDGAEAIEQAKKIHPTVILQDLFMPGVNGLDIVQLYRANAETVDTPVIVLSSEEDPQVKSQAFAVGANDYLVKLPDKVELIARIRYHAKARMSQVQRDQAFSALRESQRQLMAVNLELQRLSILDSLTGLKNRRFLNEYIEDEWKRAVRNRDALSILLIDVDDFKRYNDTYGHLAGDDALKRVSEALQAQSSGAADCVARFGGEEFAVILPKTSLSRAHSHGEQCRRGVEELGILHRSQGSPNRLTVSVGAATVIPEQGDPPVLLINTADQLLYRAKNEGKNCVRSAQHRPQAS